MGTQKLGDDRGFTRVIQSGPDPEPYTVIKKVKTAVTVYPGVLVSGNGETEGEVDLAATGDGLMGAMIVLERVACLPQDIDTAIAAASFVKCLRQSGGLFIVAAIRADESNNTELDEPMCLELTGHIKKFTYGDGAVATDSILEKGPGGTLRCAEVTTDVAGTDLVQLVHW